MDCARYGKQAKLTSYFSPFRAYFARVLFSLSLFFLLYLCPFPFLSTEDAQHARQALGVGGRRCLDVGAYVYAIIVKLETIYI